jgi:hypothetical protein
VRDSTLVVDVCGGIFLKKFFLLADLTIKRGTVGEKVKSPLCPPLRVLLVVCVGWGDQ